MYSATPRQHRGDFAVLMVCTGNVARSPLAEQLFADRLLRVFGEDAHRISVSSAGVHALVGQDMTIEAQAVARDLGVEPAPHRARQLDRGLVDRADLVLGANRAHRRFVVELAATASRKTFTLREFAHVVHWMSQTGGHRPTPSRPHDLGTDLRALTEEAARQRGLAPRPTDPEDHDIRDPFGGRRSAYRAAGRAIDSSVDAIASDLRLLTGAVARRAQPGRLSVGLS